jgi:ribosomal protein L11 methyltransferase
VKSVGPRSASYVELTVEAGEAASEALTNFLWELGAVGVVEEATAGAPARLRAFFPDSVSGAALSERVEIFLDGLRALGLAAGSGVAVTPVADTDWAAAWREHFRPIAVGRTLLVTPPWEVPAASERLVLAIEPGRAFGTGHHATTAGCLELLEALVVSERPARALDLGTGSGILAVAAARLGVAEVLACDSDPDAIAAAEGNATRNGAGQRLRVVLADAATLVTDPAPLVLANLLAAAHRALAPRYRQLVAPGGALVLGGLLDGEADGVTAALAAHGFRREAERSLEGWTSLALRHAPFHASA